MEDGAKGTPAKSPGKAGWVKKSSGKLLGRYKERYIQVENNEIVVYDSQDLQNIVERVNLANYDKCQELRSAFKKKNRLVLKRAPKTGDKVNDVKIQAKSPDEKEAWIKALTDAIYGAKNNIFDEVKVDTSCALEHVTRTRARGNQSRRPPTRIHLKEIANISSDGTVRFGLDAVHNRPNGSHLVNTAVKDSAGAKGPPMPPSKPSEDTQETASEESVHRQKVLKPPMPPSKPSEDTQETASEESDHRQKVLKPPMPPSKPSEDTQETASEESVHRQKVLKPPMPPSKPSEDTQETASEESVHRQKVLKPPMPPSKPSEDTQETASEESVHRQKVLKPPMPPSKPSEDTQETASEESDHRQKVLKPPMPPSKPSEDTQETASEESDHRQKVLKPPMPPSKPSEDTQETASEESVHRQKVLKPPMPPSKPSEDTQETVSEESVHRQKVLKPPMPPSKPSEDTQETASEESVHRQKVLKPPMPPSKPSEDTQETASEESDHRQKVLKPPKPPSKPSEDTQETASEESDHRQKVLKPPKPPSKDNKPNKEEWSHERAPSSGEEMVRGVVERRAPLTPLNKPAISAEEPENNHTSSAPSPSNRRLKFKTPMPPSKNKKLTYVTEERDSTEQSSCTEQEEQDYLPNSPNTPEADNPVSSTMPEVENLKPTVTSKHTELVKVQAGPSAPNKKGPPLPDVPTTKGKCASVGDLLYDFKVESLSPSWPSNASSVLHREVTVELVYTEKLLDAVSPGVDLQMLEKRRGFQTADGEPPKDPAPEELLAIAMKKLMKADQFLKEAKSLQEAGPFQERNRRTSW